MAYSKDILLESQWMRLLELIKSWINKKPKDLNAVLFLIGVQELGRGIANFTKEEKQDLMHIAICKVLSFSGYYQLEGVDEEGWPHWKLSRELPNFDLVEQEKLLKMHIIEYFEKELKIQI
jgi:hypothetical protein